VGWPFAAALCAPFLVEEAIFALISDRDALFDAVIRVSRGVVAALIVVVCLLRCLPVLLPCGTPDADPAASSSMAASTPSSTGRQSSCPGISSSTISSRQRAGPTCTGPSRGHSTLKT